MFTKQFHNKKQLRKYGRIGGSLGLMLPSTNSFERSCPCVHV